jgi:RNA polymerase sigma-70 factor (ECF subfamily)
MCHYPADRAMALLLSLDEQQAPVSFGGDADLRGLVEKVGAGDVAAMATLFDVHAEMVERILARILGRGRDVDLADLLQDVFVRALEGIGRLSDPRLLRPWIAGIAVRTARETIRARARRKWLRFLPGYDVPEVASPPLDDEAREALRCAYAVLEALGADERIVFCLRNIEGMELLDVARACDTSVSTVKRRLERAEQRFVVLARREPALRSWLERGTRWTEN